MIRHHRAAALFCLILMLFQILTPPSYAAAEPIGYEGHWMRSEWDRMTSMGAFIDDTLGIIDLEAPVSRSQYAGLINKAFGYTTPSEDNFTDIPAFSSYAKDMSLAKEAGYYQGDPYGEGMPEAPLSRQDAILVLNRVLGEQDDAATAGFIDADDISDYAEASVNQFYANGYIEGYPDGSLQPGKPITWGETIQLLSNVIGAYIPDEGTYTAGQVDGNLMITGEDVTLESTRITGNLYIAESVGQSEIHLNQVTVEGEIFIYGGGINSIYYQDVTSPRCTVKKKDGNIRMVASGSTNIDEVSIQSGVTLEEGTMTRGGTGFLNATITGNIPLDNQINISGDYDNVIIQSNARIKLDNCRVSNVEIKEAVKEDLTNNLNTILEIVSSSIGTLLAEAKNASIALSNGAKVGNMSIMSKVSLSFSKDSAIDSLAIGADAEGTVLEGQGTLANVASQTAGIILNGSELPVGSVSDFGSANDDSRGSNNATRSLTADTSDNNRGETVTLTIENGGGFDNNISGITIDGSPLPLVQFTVSNNTITIDAEAFPSKSIDGHSYVLDTSAAPATNIIEQAYMTYKILVTATGYKSLTTDQRLYTANNEVLPIDDQLIHYELSNTKSKPVSSLDNLIVGEGRQYLALYQLDDHGKELLVNAEEVHGGTPVFSIGDTSIVTLSSEENGYATAQFPGTTPLTIVFNGATKEITIKTGSEPPSLSKDITDALEGQPIDLTALGEAETWLSQITGVMAGDTSTSYVVTGSMITIDPDAFLSPSAREYRYESNDSKKDVSGTLYDTVTEHVYGKTEVAVSATGYVDAKVWQDIYMTSETTTTAALSLTIYSTGSDDDLVLNQEVTNQLYAKLQLEKNRYVKPGYPSGVSNAYDGVNHSLSDLDILWSSSDPSVATVDASGEVTAVGKGTVTITATYKTTSASKTLTIKEQGITINPVADVTNNDTDITYSITNSDWLSTFQAIHLIDGSGDKTELESSSYSRTHDNIIVDADNLISKNVTSGQVDVYAALDNKVVKSHHKLYSLRMSSTYYEDSTVIQPMDYGLSDIVTLKTDLDDNVLGMDIQLDYVDTPDGYDYGDTIVSITINGTEIPINQYTIQHGTITFDSGIFTTVGVYDIDVTAIDPNGIFGLGTYDLSINQVILPSVNDNADAFFLDGKTLYGVYDAADVTTSPALYLEAVGQGAYYSATYETATTTGASLIVTYKLSSSLDAGDYVVGGVPVIAVTTDSALDMITYASVINLESSSTITLTTTGALTVLADTAASPSTAEPVDNGDTIHFHHMSHSVIAYRWINGQWIVTIE